MESIERSFRVRLVAPVLCQISKVSCDYSRMPASISFKANTRQSASPKKLSIYATRSSDYQSPAPRPDLPSLTPATQCEIASFRSRSLSKNALDPDSPVIDSIRNTGNHKELIKIRNNVTPELRNRKIWPVSKASPERPIFTTPIESAKVLILEPIYSLGSVIVLFNYPPQCFKDSRINERVKGTNDFKLHFNVSSNVHTYNCVVNTFLFAGFTQHDVKYNVLISGVPKVNMIRQLNEFQKISHFPASKELGRKDRLWKNVNAMRRKFNKEYEICPKTYVIPEDYDLLEAQMEIKKKLWILKPAAASCGRGIKVINSISEVSKKNRYVVSKYISNPHTINKYKYDLRVYVCVTSFDPLRIFIYQDGLVRFATEHYAKNKKSLKKRYIHLTNFSVNKRSKNFIKVKSDSTEGEGSKWSFTALKKKFIELGLDYDLVFTNIEDIIIKTLIAVEPHMISSLSSQKYRNTCFELYGFDILIDSNLRPWLLEVNILPSLSSSSPMDKKIKTSLMCDIFTLIGVVPYKPNDVSESPNKSNYRNLVDLQNCTSLEDYVLSEDDLQILVNCEEENYRVGNFKKIFPVKKNIDAYAKYFSTPRYNNLLLWKHLKSYTNIVSKYCKRLHPAIGV
jgi:tubulin polyglutamylase TTLL4